MKDLQANQYERIARKLDGSEEALSDTERAAAEEIRQLEADVQGRLDTAIPPVVVSRVRERLADGLWRRRRFVRLRLFSGVAAAAGLLLAVAAAYWVHGPASTPTPMAKTPTNGGAASAVRVSDDWHLDATNALLTLNNSADLLTLDREMNALEAGMMASSPAADVELDALEREFQDFLADNGTMLLPGL